MSAQPGASPQSKSTPEAGSAELQSAATTAEQVDADSEGRIIPAPESFPKAPPIDLATIRVNWVEQPKRKSGYFLSRSYVEGIEISQVNASSREAALAGAIASIETAWRGTESQAKKWKQ